MSLASLLPPIDLGEWIRDHRAELVPPVGNRCIVDGDFIVMIVAGPNQRSDWHYDEGPEFFQQIEGEMVLRLRDAEEVRDVPIRAGEMFYLPPRVWHSPQRRPGSIGLVVERKRLAHERDGLAWFCPACDARLHEVFFTLTDIETDLPPLFARFNGDLDLRTCKRCGAVHPLPEAAK